MGIQWHTCCVWQPHDLDVRLGWKKKKKPGRHNRELSDALDTDFGCKSAWECFYLLVWFEREKKKKDVVITHIQLLQTDEGKTKETREELAVLWHGSEREIFRKEELSVWGMSLIRKRDSADGWKKPAAHFSIKHVNTKSRQQSRRESWVNTEPCCDYTLPTPPPPLPLVVDIAIPMNTLIQLNFCFSMLYISVFFIPSCG